MPTIVAAFIGTRVLLFIAALFVESMVLVDPERRAWDSRPILSSLTGFDAEYYLGIAADGYHVEPIHGAFRDWAFFPAYPLAVRIASVATFGDLTWAALLVSNLALLAAMVALFVLSRRYFDEDLALRSVVYLSISPGAVALGMAYSDSLFLLAAIGSFLAAEGRRSALMATGLVIATLARPPGVLLVLPLAVLILQGPRARRRSLIWLAAAPLSLLAFAAYQGVSLGNPLAFLVAQQAWNFPDRSAGLSAGMTAAFDPAPWLLTGVLCFHIFLLVFARADRVPVPYTVMAAMALLTVLGSSRLLSLPRYLAVVWPFDWIVAARRPKWFRSTWPVASAGLFMLFAVLHFTSALAP